MIIYPALGTFGDATGQAPRFDRRPLDTVADVRPPGRLKIATGQDLVLGVSTGGQVGAIEPRMTQEEMEDVVRAHWEASRRTAEVGFIDEMYIGGDPDWGVDAQLTAVAAAPSAVPVLAGGVPDPWTTYLLPRTWSSMTETSGAAWDQLLLDNEPLLPVIAASQAVGPDMYATRDVGGRASLLVRSVQANMAMVRSRLVAAGTPDKPVRPFVSGRYFQPLGQSGVIPGRLIALQFEILAGEGVTHCYWWNGVDNTPTLGSVAEVNESMRALADALHGFRGPSRFVSLGGGGRALAAGGGGGGSEA